MATTVVRPADPSFRDAWRLAALFAVIKVLFHIAATAWTIHLGYGYFRDEFYYIQCGRHLAWGYVDHGPIVALQSRLAILLFGKSLYGIRMLSAFAGAARILLTGLICWAMGGRRPAQALAMFSVSVGGIYLALDSFLSMNSFESLFWMTCILALILVLRTGNQRLWLLWGAAAGLGLLNKPSMTFFLTALLIGLLLTQQRRLLFNRWAAAGVALMILIALPNLVWQIQNHWPTLEFLENGRIKGKNLTLAPLEFLKQQILILAPATILVWFTGLLWLFRSPLARAYRWIGLTYLFFLAITMALHAKDYYVVPIYPMLFAAGAIAWENYFAKTRFVRENRIFAFPIFETIILAGAAVTLPMAIPILRPASWVAYAKAIHMYNITESETAATGPLPQFYADRFGWQEEVDIVTRAYDSLSPEEKASTCLWGSNYGEAGALEFLGRNLPTVISGHNNYFLWGPRGCTGKVIIAVTPTANADLIREYQSIELVGHIDNPWSMPYEHRNIYILRGRKDPLAPGWSEHKDYI